MGIASFPDDADSLEFITRGSFYLAASVVESGINQFINSLSKRLFPIAKHFGPHMRPCCRRGTTMA